MKKGGWLFIHKGVNFREFYVLNFFEYGYPVRVEILRIFCICECKL